MSVFDLWAMVDAASTTAEMNATRRPRFLESIELVLNLPDVQVDKRGGYDNGTPLHTAVCHGDLAITKMLLTHRADPNKEYGFKNETALHCVHKFETYEDDTRQVQNTRLAIASELLKFGANVNARNSSGNTALFFTTTMPRTDVRMFMLLIEYRADVSLVGNDMIGHKHTLLENVMQRFYKQDGIRYLAPLLLEHGADINEVSDYYRRTVLHSAVCNNHYTLDQEVTFLIENGILNLKDKYGRTAAELAISRGLPLVADHINNQFQLQIDRYIAFAMGTHDRLGEISHVNPMTRDVLQLVLRLGKN